MTYRLNVTRSPVLAAFLTALMWFGGIDAVDHGMSVLGQEIGDPAGVVSDREDTRPAGEAENVDVAKQVSVAPVNSDDQIASRLTDIFEATNWFRLIEVRVDRGVAFLSGVAETQAHKAWADETAMNTSDVVAVVNRIQVTETPIWDLQPAWQSLRELGRDSIALLPLALVALAIAILSYYVARLAAALIRRLSKHRIENRLLRDVTGNVVGVLIFIIGIYIALRVSGLTRLAVTLLGGTGLVGLALGFAFRDIAENYLASILISLHRPFRVGDLIEVEGSQGFVRTVTTRGTILNTLEGNQVQIPNSTVYKGRIVNYTATPLLRLTFTVGIGFDDSASRAQELIMKVLNAHVGIVADPPPLVLVESLGAATVNLRVYYWLNQSSHSGLKVGSSVIRQVKETFVVEGISMPDEAREIVFPAGVPVELVGLSELTLRSESESVDGQNAEARPSTVRARAKASESSESPKSSNAKPATSRAAKESAISEGEGDLTNEQSEVMRATRDDQTVNDQANLIK